MQAWWKAGEAREGRESRDTPQPPRPGGGVVPQRAKEVADLCSPRGRLEQQKEDLQDRAGGRPSLQAAAAAATWSVPAGCRPQRGRQERDRRRLPRASLGGSPGRTVPHQASERGSAPGRICLPAARRARPRRAHTHARTRAPIHTHTHPHTCGRQGRAAGSLNISVRARRSPGRRSALPAALRTSC